MILKASAANGSERSARRSTRVAVEVDAVDRGTSSGDGRKSITASSSGCTPLFLKAEPHRTGTTQLDRRRANRLADARPRRSRAPRGSARAAPRRSRRPPRAGARASSSTSSAQSSGIGSSWKLAPRLSSSQIEWPSWSIRSTTPRKPSSSPDRVAAAPAAVAPRRFSICSTTAEEVGARRGPSC